MGSDSLKATRVDHCRRVTFNITFSLICNSDDLSVILTRHKYEDFECGVAFITNYALLRIDLSGIMIGVAIFVLFSTNISDLILHVLSCSDFDCIDLILACYLFLVTLILQQVALVTLSSFQVILTWRFFKFVSIHFECHLILAQLPIYKF